MLDDDLVTIIARQGGAHLVTFDRSSAADDVTAHSALAQRVGDLGGQDAGMTKETVAVSARLLSRVGTSS